MDNKKLIEKIKKLLSLAQSSNQNEAEIASKKAQELLLKHNISMATVKNAQFEFIENRTDLPKRQPVENKFIHAILSKFFFVQIILDQVDQNTVIVGKPENVEVALYVMDFLKNSFKSLYKLENEKQGWAGKHRKAFYFGLYKGLVDKLDEERAKQVNTEDVENALIVLDKALINHVRDAFKGIKFTANRMRPTNAEAVAEGYSQGRKLNISKGMASSDNNSQQRLGS